MFTVCPDIVTSVSNHQRRDSDTGKKKIGLTLIEKVGFRFVFNETWEFSKMT